jgi:hypothetical protein
MGVLSQPEKLNAGVSDGWAAGNDQLVPSGIPACGRDGGRRARHRVRHPEDAVADIAQVPHLETKWLLVGWCMQAGEPADQIIVGHNLALRFC